VVLPFFLFDGVLVKRIYAAADELAAREPGVEVLKAAYLGVHAHVADVMLERARSREGRAMNCTLCKYRVQIVGFEQQVGEPQRAHHCRCAICCARAAAAPARTAPYVPHPIEAESMEIIQAGRDWSGFPPEHLTVLQRLVHTSGDFAVADEIYFSAGAVQAGMKALLRCQAGSHRCDHGGDRPQARGSGTAGCGDLVRRARSRIAPDGAESGHDAFGRRYPPRLAEVRQRHGAGHR
jgi:precorrin-8X/cobalt-precorrin-8 methylmutase